MKKAKKKVKKVAPKKTKKTKKAKQPIVKKFAKKATKPTKKAKPVPKPVKKAKPAKKAKPVPKPTKKTKPVAKPVKKAPKKLDKKVKKTAPKKVAKKKKVKELVPPRLAWPPPGAIVQGKVKYIVPQPGEEPIILAKEHFTPGLPVPGEPINPTPGKKDSMNGIVVNFQKGVDGWAGHIRVTRNDELVANIFAKTWKGALDSLRTNYGINILVPKLV